VNKLAISAALLVALAGCGSEENEAPSDHTLNLDGVKHKPGLTAPLTNCTGCHGASLQGGEGPSCTSCHGVKW
jgi:hypothetical protein